MLEATKPIISIKVSIVETVKASRAQGWIAVHWHPSHSTWHRSAVHRHSGNRTWRQSAAHSHPGHRITLSSHLRRRNRGCENAC